MAALCDVNISWSALEVVKKLSLLRRFAFVAIINKIITLCHSSCAFITLSEKSKCIVGRFSMSVHSYILCIKLLIYFDTVYFASASFVFWSWLGAGCPDNQRSIPSSNWDLSSCQVIEREFLDSPAARLLVQCEGLRRNRDITYKCIKIPTFVVDCSAICFYSWWHWMKLKFVSLSLSLSKRTPMKG